MLNYVSLFSSAGIGCYGLNSLGFECIATADLVEKRLHIQKHNKKCKYESGYILGDLASEETHSKLYEEVKKFKRLENTKEIDVLIATPPCQGMSVANHKKKEELTRNSLVVESIKIVKGLHPRFFIFENVSAFLQSICTDTDGQDKTIKEAIRINLASNYYIESKVLNLKNYGSNSSRTRTIVIGVRRDQERVTPLDLFPDYRNEKTLHEVIGHLPALKNMGEFSDGDIYHSFRPYKIEMLKWIQETPYGKSAFDNKDEKLRPHQIVNGKIITNKSKNGDKYQRQTWEKVAPCIHTRSDCLPSQNTVHPVDNRVFSIRELMLMMSIPDSLKWVNTSDLPLENASYEEKYRFRKKFEFNIRQCIGEAVPTAVISGIGQKIKAINAQQVLSDKQLSSLINDHNLDDVDNLCRFIENNWKHFSQEDMFKLCELSNAQKFDTAAYYTKKNICFSALEYIPEIKKDSIRVLEPSVGVGNFIPLIIKKFEGKKIYVDCVDINESSLRICKLLCKLYISNPDVKIHFHHADFLTWNVKDKYDLVVGNPPYMKVINNENLTNYRREARNKKTNNIFSFFMEKSAKLSDLVSLIVPKAFLNAPDYLETRRFLENYTLLHINDYNEKAFDVKIETISVTFQTKRAKEDNVLSIYSYLNKKYFQKRQNYITHTFFSSWLLYRDEWFDEVYNTLELGRFKVYRDRCITKAHTLEKGKYRVIKSRNIGHGEIINIAGYDSYINDISNLASNKFLNQEVIVVPNLTYNPRAAKLPKGCIADGSAAILYSDMKVTDDHIAYFSSPEFNKFYRIARNFGTRSMNIDSVSVKYFGIKAEHLET